MNKPEVFPFYDQQTQSFSYVVKDPTSKSCAIIDAVLNFDYASGGTSHEGADEIIAHIKKHQLKVEWIIETHMHADHLTAADYLKEKLGGTTAISKHIVEVQAIFTKVFNIANEFTPDGSQFDHLFADGENYRIGNLQATALYTPGHTPACMTHLIGDSAFVGDTLFMPDVGTARVDFPGGDAHTLYESIQQILRLREDTRLFMCHDYPPESREVEYETNVSAEKHHNIHVNINMSEEAFTQLRKNRDKTLGMPRLILPSLQINMRAGKLPKAENNALSYLKIPLNAFK